MTSGRAGLPRSSLGSRRATPLVREARPRGDGRARLVTWAQPSKSCGEPLEILLIARVGDVNVVAWVGGSAGDACESPDQHEVDFVLAELLKDRFRLELNRFVRRGARSSEPREDGFSGVNAAQLLCDRDFVSIDVADFLAAALGSLPAQPIGLLPALAKRLCALPEGADDEPAARPVGEADHADASLQVENLRQRFGLHFADAFIDAVR